MIIKHYPQMYGIGRAGRARFVQGSLTWKAVLGF